MKQRTKKLALTRAQLASRNAPEKFDGRQANKDIRHAVRVIVQRFPAIVEAVVSSLLARQAMRERQSATIH
jgi:hypothetical protein